MGLFDDWATEHFRVFQHPPHPRRWKRPFTCDPLLELKGVFWLEEDAPWPGEFAGPAPRFRFTCSLWWLDGQFYGGDRLVRFKISEANGYKVVKLLDRAIDEIEEAARHPTVDDSSLARRMLENRISMVFQEDLAQLTVLP
jgi:hypothetical protein